MDPAPALPHGEESRSPCKVSREPEGLLMTRIVLMNLSSMIPSMWGTLSIFAQVHEG